MSMPDLTPNGEPLATSNPADDGPHECLWCGGDATFGNVVEIQKSEAEDHGKAVHGKDVLLCEECNDNRIASWSTESIDTAFNEISELVDVCPMVEPSVRADRVAAAIRGLQAKVAARPVAVLPELLAVEKFADNGARSHWIIIRRDTGEAVWEEPDIDDSRTEIPLTIHSVTPDRVLGEGEVAVPSQILEGTGGAL